MKLSTSQGVITVGCGKCYACHYNRRQEWIVRLEHEFETSNHEAFFLTLTYADEHLPEGGTLVKKHLQDYFKRLRISLKRSAKASSGYPARQAASTKFKHFSVGEYGEKRFRPHYHAIVFGLGEAEKELIEKKWSYGFVQIGNLTYGGIRYVVKYMNKQINVINQMHENVLSGALQKDIDAWFEKNGLQPPFKIGSNGLGKDWCMENRTSLMTDGCLWRKGKPLHIPRYYAKILQEYYYITTGFDEPLHAALQRSKKRSEEISAEYSQKYHGVSLTEREVYEYGYSCDMEERLRKSARKKMLAAAASSNQK